MEVFKGKSSFDCPDTPPCYLYDSGSVWITVNGYTASVNYSGTLNSNRIAVATALKNKLNVAASPVTATSSSDVVYVTAKATGAASNYTLSAGTNWFSYFASPPFPPAASGANLTGGADATSFPDTGTVTLTISGVSKVANYGGSSDKNSIAMDLASQFNADANSPVNADAAGATIWVVSKVEGFWSNYTLTTASATNQPGTFSIPSYTAAGSNLSGGGGSPGINNPISTLYTYAVLGGLTRVVQGVQTRTYNYDSLGRLKDVTTPEAGLVQYTYTNFSAVQNRTDARGVITTYGYDPLNRVQTISYDTGRATGVAPTAGVSYTYGTSSAANNNGRLLSMTDGVGSETYTYNNLGQIAQVAKVISGTTYTTGYAYNLAGELQTLTYPSGRVVTQTFDAIGRLNQISSSGTNYLTVPANGYNAAGQLLNVTFGNTVAGTYTYNDHLQLDSLKYMLSATELLNLDYKYAAPNGGNNGQIQGIDDNTGGTNIPAKSTTYSYDDWSRLSAAQTNNLTASETWQLGWGYDRYGNRLSQSLLGGTLSVTAPQLSISPTTNRITSAGYQYDLNGNLTNDSLHSYIYDAENRLLRVDSNRGAYTYDGNSLRVKRLASRITTTYIFSGSKVIAEYVNGSLSKEYIYSGSLLLATIAGSATTYSHADHLSTRLETNSTGAMSRTFGHLPFGDVWYETGTANKWKFTSYERDSESQLDYAILRFDSWRLGRFMSPDPLGGDIVNPQSLNRYSYVGNNPINRVDPFGLECFDPITGEPVECTPDGTPEPGEGPGNSGFDASLGTCHTWTLDNFCLDFIMNMQLIQFVDGNSECFVPIEGGCLDAALSPISTHILKDVFRALQMASCLALFPGANPQQLMAQLLLGNAGVGNSNFQMGDRGGVSGGRVRAATTEPVHARATIVLPNGSSVYANLGIAGASVTINSNSAAPFQAGYNGYLGLNESQSRAATIIHELGHVAELTKGPNSTRIQPDDGLPAVSRSNSQLVADNCF